MRDLHGSEGNATPLVAEDFEKSVANPVYRVWVWKAGWQEVQEPINLSCDFHYGRRIVSASYQMTVDDKEANYHPMSSTPQSDWFTYGRKVKINMGIEKNGTPYTWPYFEGYIRSVRHTRTGEHGRKVMVRALDYCDVLNAHHFDDDIYWGTTTGITLQEGKYEYTLPGACKGIHKVVKDGEEYLDYTYNWETNVLALLGDDEGPVTVHYYTTHNVLSIVEDILDMTLIGSGDLVHDSVTKNVDRVYFEKGTSAMRAIELLCEIVNFRFFFGGDGVPHFQEEYKPGATPVFTFRDFANIEQGDVEISDHEYYNAVEVFGEERWRQRYLKEEQQIGSTSSSLDADTVSRDHHFNYTNKDRVRYELDATNRSGLTSEMLETKTGATISTMHNPERSFEEDETSLGSVTGNLSHTVVGKTIKNVSAVRVLPHVPATRVRYSIPDEFNRFGLSVELNPLDYRNTEINLSHDPMRHLSTDATYLGRVDGTLSHTEDGKKIESTEDTRERSHVLASGIHYRVPEGYNRFGLNVNLNQKDGWTTEVNLTHDPMRHLKDTETYLGDIVGSLSHTVDGKTIKGTEETKSLSHILAARIRHVVDENYNRFGLSVNLNPIDHWTTEATLTHDPMRHLSTTKTHLGNLTGSLSHYVEGKVIKGTDTTRTLNHILAGRVHHEFRDQENTAGLSINLNPVDYWTTEAYLNHDPLRHLRTTDSLLGTVTGSLGHTVDGGKIKGTEVTRSINHSLATRVRAIVPEHINRFGLVTNINPVDFWTTEIHLTHDPLRHLRDTETYLGRILGSLHYNLSFGEIVNTSETKNLNHILATRIRGEVPSAYNKIGLFVAYNPINFWNTEVTASHDPLRNLSSAVQQIGSASSTATTAGRLITVNFTAGKIFGNVRWEASFATGWGAEQNTGWKSFDYFGPGSRTGSVSLPGNVGQQRWEGQKPATGPSVTETLGSGTTAPANSWQNHYIVGMSHSYFHSWNTRAQGTPPDGVYLRDVDESITNTSYSFYQWIWNTTNQSHYIPYRVTYTVPAATYEIIPLGASASLARFRFESSWGANVGSHTYQVRVFYRRMPYGTRVVQEEVTTRRAVFKATCDHSTPPVTIVCHGQEPTPRSYEVRLYGYEPTSRPYEVQIRGFYPTARPYHVRIYGYQPITRPYRIHLYGYEPTPRPYRVNLYGYQPTTRPYRIDLRGNRLIPRSYFIRLYGRDIVPERTLEIYTHNSLTPAEIDEVGGKKTLSIRNHLIQTKADAETIAQDYLDYYSQHVSSYSIKTTCPPPIEIGDTVQIEAQP